MSRMVTNLELKGAIPADPSCRPTVVSFILSRSSAGPNQDRGRAREPTYASRRLAQACVPTLKCDACCPVLRTTSFSSGGTRVAAGNPCITITSHLSALGENLNPAQRIRVEGFDHMTTAGARQKRPRGASARGARTCPNQIAVAWVAKTGSRPARGQPQPWPAQVSDCQYKNQVQPHQRAEAGAGKPTQQLG
jgi:hypothetical protein